LVGIDRKDAPKEAEWLWVLKCHGHLKSSSTSKAGTSPYDLYCVGVA
jgi:hypothetical protein